MHKGTTSSRRGRLARSATAIAAGLLATGALAGTAAAVEAPASAGGGYNFTTLNDQADPTFNQLLGINDSGLIAGYFGSGQTVSGVLHPNKGYRLAPPYGQANYHNENFPGSVQTQVTGLNNRGVTVGFFVDGGGNQLGFYYAHGRYHVVNYPTHDPANPAVDQVLGVNDDGIAVGFYTDAHMVNHGYVYNIHTHRYHLLRTPGDTGTTAAGINDLGDVAGFGTNGAGNTEAFLKLGDGRIYHLNYPGASATSALGVNNGDVVVGFYMVGTGDAAQTHGFTWAPGLGFQSVDDPNGIGTTTVNGINDRGDLVGFYTDGAGNVDGMLATPAMP